MKVKRTVFEGFMSGDGECFCLDDEKVPALEKKLRERGRENFIQVYNELERHRVYPSVFFPEECKKGKWKFEITVTASKVK